MQPAFQPSFPSIESLRIQTRKRIPGFAFEYLDGGCNENLNLEKNTREIRALELKPVYLRSFTEVNLETKVLGETYSAPFGIAPIGLQGLIWPGAPEILARAASSENIPFILSTVSTASIETIAGLTEGRAWYQLYHPADPAITADILRRVWDSGIRTLVLLCDVPSFGFRPADIRNGLAMPPRMTLRNVLQMIQRPRWAMQTLRQGTPRFETLRPYMDRNLNMSQLGKFMNQTFSGRLSEEKIARLRDAWKGQIVLKGVASTEDVQTATRLGLEAVIVSNHGGRQLDAGQSSIHAFRQIAAECKGKIVLMLDSGVRSGPDIARVLACGADFVFLGRSFMYGVGALGKQGGQHTIRLLKAQLKQVMEQVNCERPTQLADTLV